MAESDNVKSLSEDYQLKDTKEKVDAGTKPGDESAEKDTAEAASEVPVTADPEEAPVTADPVEVPVTTDVDESVPASADTSKGSDATTGENVAAAVNSDKDVTETSPAASEESSESPNQEKADDETSGIKLETAPGDYRFPTTNQSRHCFTRYVEYHRCVAAKGDDAPECDKFAKYYRSLCPGEWIERWNEQRENGTFPGPL